MSNLKELRSSIANAQSTGRITSAMKMVAAAKLKKAEQEAGAARPYAVLMHNMMAALASGGDERFPLLSGNGKDKVHLLIVMTSDRGLCGGFNSSLLRATRRRIVDLQAKGKEVKLLIIGRKGASSLRRDFGSIIMETYEDLVKPLPKFAMADMVTQKIIKSFEANEFDVCTVIYNKFISALTQEVTPLQLIPFASLDATESKNESASYEFEPDEEEILNKLLPRNLSVQIFRAILESFASEQGSRMTAMDSATRNVGDMINKLTIRYNRIRQAQITKELIEIISGAEAL